MMLALLVAVVIVAGVIYVRTASFGRLLKGQVGNLLATGFRGEITLGEIDTSIRGALVVHELSIKYRGAAIVRISQIRLDYSLIPLLWHEARIEITAVDPAIDLQRESDGEWNLMKALSSSKSPAAGNSGLGAFTIYIERISIHNGAVDVQPQGVDGPHYRFAGTDLDAHLAIKSAGVDAELSELRTRVAAPGMPPADLYAAISYSKGNGQAKIGINTIRLTTQASAVSLTGTVRDIQTWGGDVAIVIDKLGASDVSAILHNYPLRQDIKGRISLKGSANAARGQADLAAGNARLKGNLLADLTRKAPIFNGGLSLTGLDLTALVIPQKLAGMLDGSVDARGEGSGLQALVANAKIKIKALRVGRADIGNVDLIAGAQHGKAQFTGDLTEWTWASESRRHRGGCGEPAISSRNQDGTFQCRQNFTGQRRRQIYRRTVIAGSGSNLQKIDARVDFRAARSVVARVPLEVAIRVRTDEVVLDISRQNGQAKEP